MRPTLSPTLRATTSPICRWGGELLFSLGLALGGGAGANMVVVLGGLACVLGIYGAASQRWGPEFGAAGAATFASTPLVACLFGTCDVDLIVCMHVVLAVVAVLNYRSASNMRWLVLAGICGGLATCTKLGGGYATALVAIWAGLAGEGHWRGFAKRFLAVAIPAGLLFAPWLVKSAIVTGNPVFPMFYDVFGGKDWRPEYTANYAGEVASYGRPGGSILDYLLSPLWITMDWRPYGTPVPLNPIHLVMLVGLPLLGKRVKPIWALTAWCAGFWLAWLFTAQVARFALPGVAVFSIAAGFVAVQSGISKKTSKPRLPLHVALIILGMAGACWYNHWKFFQPQPYLVGGATKLEYMMEMPEPMGHALDYYPLAIYANENLPEGSRLLFFGETLAYNVKHPVLADTGFAGVSAVWWAEEAADAEALARRIASEGYTHILVDHKAPRDLWAQKFGYFGDSQEALDRFMAMIRAYCRPLHAHDRAVLFELAPPD